jgi:general secretion pathway protein G
MQKHQSGEGGFTLIELLIVIVILGILAAVVVLAIGGLSGESQEAACNSGLKTMEVAEDAYFATNQTYGSKAQLLSEGLLKSDTPDFAATGDATGYDITGQGKCAGTDASYTVP